MALVALMEAKLGNFEEAELLAEEAARLAPADPRVLYHRGVVDALSGRQLDAIEWLRRSIEHGYSLGEVRADDDLDSLRDLQPFRALVSD